MRRGPPTISPLVIIANIEKIALKRGFFSSLLVDIGLQHWQVRFGPTGDIALGRPARSGIAERGYQVDLAAESPVIRSLARTKSRTCAMKQPTAGFTVRFFSVNITNGQGRTDSSTGNIFTGD